MGYYNMLILMHTRECGWCSDRLICLGCREEPLVPLLVPPPQGAAPKGKAQHWKLSACGNSLSMWTSYPHWNHAHFCPPPVVSSCRDIWDHNHFLANKTLTQTTTASAFQRCQFSPAAGSPSKPVACLERPNFAGTAQLKAPQSRDHYLKMNC